MAAIVSVKELLESGVHFGHPVSRWNPKMKPYIYGKRNLIHIIDLKRTVEGLVRGYHFLSRLAARGDLVLFVGTKKQGKIVIEREAQRVGMPYVSERWIGGTLTNFHVIRTRLNRLLEIERMETDGTMDLYTKKERANLQREKRKLKRNLDGIRNMERLPGAMVIVDPRREKIALTEATRMGIPTVSLIDTDGNPELVDVPIPGNDDAMRVIQIIIGRLADAIAEGRGNMAQAAEVRAKAQATAKAEAPPAAPKGEAGPAGSGSTAS